MCVCVCVCVCGVFCDECVFVLCVSDVCLRVVLCLLYVFVWGMFVLFAWCVFISYTTGVWYIFVYGKFVWCLFMWHVFLLCMFLYYILA